MRADLVVEGDRLDDVQELALVFVDALDLDVEDRARIDLRRHALADEIGELLLVAALDRREALAEGGIVGQRIEIGDLLDVVEEGRADRIGHKFGEAGIGLHDPAARGHAIGLVLDPVGIEQVEMVEHRLLHQFGVQGRDAVDGMAADEGELAHAHAPAIALVDQRDRGDPGIVEALLLRRLADDAGIDGVDDLHLARQEPLEQMDRPVLQRLGQQRMIGVGEGVAGDLPGLGPFMAVHVDQEPHQLGDRDRRMGVVELDRELVGEVGQILVGVEMAPDDVLQRGGGEEVFLPQAQFLASLVRVGRIEDAGDRLGLVGFDQGADVIAGIEGVEQDRVERLGAPQAQRVHAASAPADDRRVVGDGENALGRAPDLPGRAAGLLDGGDLAAEADLVGKFAALELPGIAMGEPGFGQLHLGAVGDFLAEEAVDVADAVAEAGNVGGGHRLHEAGGEAAEAAIAERGVGLQQFDEIEIDAIARQRLADRLGQVEIVDRVAQQAADQEFHRQVADALLAAGLGALGGFHPLVDDPVADDQRRRLEPVVAPRLGRGLADGVGQLLDDLPGQRLRVVLAGCRCRGTGSVQGGIDLVRHVGHHDPLSLWIAATRPAVELSRPSAEVSPVMTGTSRLASSLPSSTPH